MGQRPLALSLLLCEQVIVDNRSKRVTPVNCFSTLTVGETPTEPQAFWVFAVLTDGQGSLPATVEIERLDEGDWLIRRGFTIRMDSPLQRVRCMLQFRHVTFPAAGTFQATLIIAGESVASTRFSVLQEE